ncbi:sorting and assembly machinery component 50 homolog A [Spodoptera frugiperda]|uniref:Sorting and assembly machinery component 50 homolog A n=2 Tax=Spodoptera frugiperda TaxID=7108 RepID=A0A9R0ERS9_SPOFR|nr:sorting and assembly machinery component 50 homolog A [Spodoptera frugiperda]
MGIVHAKERKYNFAEDEAGLFDGEEPELDEGPVPRATIALRGVRARVDRVNVDGLHRTKDDVIKGTVDDLFEAKDFEDVIVRAHKVRQALDNLGCFREVCVYIDVSSGPEATPDGLEVTFQVRELSRVAAAVTTDVSEDEGSVVLGVKLPNVLGRGERAAAGYSLGHLRSTDMHLALTKPLLLHRYKPVVSGSLYQRAADHVSSGYRLLDRGLLLDLAFQTSPTTKHHVQWEGLMREMSVSNKTSFKVRESSGPQLKSMVRHMISVDQRDEAVFPTRGARLHICNELAGLGGSVASLRAELHLQLNYTLSQKLGLVVQASGAAGLLHDVYGSSVADHFFLGGAASLRGFQHRGAGPHCDGHALGGRMYWAGGLHVFAPLPVPGAGSGLGALFRSHLFLNTGCVAFPDRGSAGEWWRGLGAARGAGGAGLCVRLGRAARLELSYVLPLRWLPGDRTHAGIQLGLGANFL